MKPDFTNADHTSRIVSIGLDSYEDIFSDFDPRPFHERNISDDFLYELKKVSGESDQAVTDLQLLMPPKARDPANEEVIAKRLHAHFRKNFGLLQTEMKGKKKKGALLTFSGCILMLFASYVSLIKSGNILLHTLLVILEPAGWFMIWTGLDILFGSFKKGRPERDFFNKISKSKIVFVGT